VRFAEDDRMQVSRVIIERGGVLEEIRSCWIAVTPARNRIGIWLTPADNEPTLLLSLDEVIIEWQKVDLPSIPA
jgi:hypothetical protein